MYKDIIDAVNYIKSKSKGIIVSCSINSHLKTSVETVRKLVNIIDTIQISMDGIDEVYEKVRINGNFNFFLTNLKEIVELTSNSDTDVILNVVIVKENYNQMPEIIKFAGDLGIRYINMIPINLVSKTTEDVSYYDFYFSQEYIDTLESARETARKYKEMEFTYSEFSKNGGFNLCKYPWNYFYISWDGLLPPCCAKPFPKELNFGDVFENGLKESLNSKLFRDFRRLWFQNKTPDFCKKCSVIYQAK